MGFPTTNLLDSFAGGDETPITTNWSDIAGGATGVDKVSNSVRDSNPGTGSGSYWDLSTFGPDMEAWYTMSAAPDNGGAHYSMVRLQDEGTSGWDGYYGTAFRDDSGGDLLINYRVDNGVSTLLDFTGITLTSGDKYGTRIVGSTITSYQNTGSGWVLGPTSTDSTYTGVGYIGILLYDVVSSTGRADDFGGGSIQTIPRRRIEGY